MEHVELEEFLDIIADIADAGWAVKVVRENEIISDQVPGASDSYVSCLGFEACVRQGGQEQGRVCEQDGEVIKHNK